MKVDNKANPASYNVIDKYNYFGRIISHKGPKLGKEKRDFDPTKYGHHQAVLIKKGIF